MKTQDRIKAKDRKPRNSDGTLRRSSRPAKLTDRSLIARWVEAESVKLKRLGNSFTTIAAHITAVGRGQKQPVTPRPDVQFPSDYMISAQGCQKAYHVAMDREPALQVEEHRRLNTARCEDMLLNLQPAIARGRTRSIEVAIRVLDQEADLNGLHAATKRELTGKDGGPLSMDIARQIIDTIDDDGEK